MSPSFSENWLWSESGQPPESSQDLAARFRLDSRACTDRTENLRRVPRRADDPSLEPRVDPKREFESEWEDDYVSCMTDAGWKMRER